MKIRGPHDPGALVYFRHRDATHRPKGGRPGIIDRLRSGNVSLFYGSTFKRGGQPPDAIQADPRADLGTEARVLADYLGGFVDQLTYFHGSLVSEAPVGDGGLRPFPTARFPGDLLDDLREQAEDRVLAFSLAWERLRWLQPAVRARLLESLWWRLEVDAITETLLTLVLCDGWLVTEVAGLAWRDLDVRHGIARVGAEGRWLLPRTGGLLSLLSRNGRLVFDPLTRPELLERLRVGWEGLVRAAQPRGRRTSAFPRWEQVRGWIDPVEGPQLGAGA